MSCSQKNNECCHTFIRDDLLLFEDDFRQLSRTEAIATGLLLQLNIIEKRIEAHASSLPPNYVALLDDIDRFTPLISQAVNAIVDEATFTNALINVLLQLQFDLQNCVFNTATNNNSKQNSCNMSNMQSNNTQNISSITSLDQLNSLMKSIQMDTTNEDNCGQANTNKNIVNLINRIQAFQNLTSSDIGSLDSLGGFIMTLNEAVLVPNDPLIVTTTQQISTVFKAINTIADPILTAFDALYQLINAFISEIIACGFIESCIPKTGDRILISCSKDKPVIKCKKY